MIQSLIKQVIYCILILAAVVIPCVLVLLPVRFKTKIPQFVFRKLLHTVSFAAVALMIVKAGSWQAAAITSALVGVCVWPIILLFEKTSWYSGFVVEKSPGEVRRSLSVLFLVLAVIICIAGGIFGKLKLAAVAIVMWGTGDAAAALVGIPFGKHKVKIKPADGRKSWEGSLAMLAVSFVFGFVMLLAVQRWPLSCSLPAALIAAVVAAAVELFSPGVIDTFTVPAAVLAVLLIFAKTLR